jgi:hypothetical protein
MVNANSNGALTMAPGNSPITPPPEKRRYLAYHWQRQSGKRTPPEKEQSWDLSYHGVMR